MTKDVMIRIKGLQYAEGQESEVQRYETYGDPARSRGILHEF